MPYLPEYDSPELLEGVKNKTMNRPIKLRAWHTKESRWVTSSEFLNETKVSASQRPPSTLEMNHPDWVIQEYIGITDKDGVEIYVGDIDQDGGVFVWVPDSCSYCINYTDGGLMPIKDSMTNWCEIIGNIYEHPHLIHNAS